MLFLIYKKVFSYTLFTFSYAGLLNLPVNVTANGVEITVYRKW